MTKATREKKASQYSGIFNEIAKIFPMNTLNNGSTLIQKLRKFPSIWMKSSKPRNFSLVAFAAREKLSLVAFAFLLLLLLMIFGCNEKDAIS